MTTTIIASLIIGIILFELVEHVIFPLAWLIIKRRKTSMCDVHSLEGKVAEVRQWRNDQGKVMIQGELWNAVSENSFSPGSEVIIERVDGLVLKVKPFSS
jgi:membrane protein implicated in regulation of membrane protease activity